MPLSAKVPAEPDEIPIATETLTDEEIVRQVLDGDGAAFERIMRRYNQRLFRVVRGILGDDSEADDVVQESYLRAYEHLGQFEGRSRFSTWLTKIAVYEATARRRKRRRLRFVPLGDPEADALASPSQPGGAEGASSTELRHMLAGLIDALPTDLRIVFMMRVVEQLSTNQTAECLDLTPSNVKVRLHRARSLLQSWIDQRIGEEARRLYVFDGEHCDRIVRNVLERLSRDRS